MHFFRPRPLRHCTFTQKVGNLHSVPRPAASLLSQLHLQDPTSRIQVAQLTPHTEGRAARDSATQLLSLDVGFTVLKAFGFLLDFATNDLHLAAPNHFEANCVPHVLSSITQFCEELQNIREHLKKDGKCKRRLLMGRDSF